MTIDLVDRSPFVIVQISGRMTLGRELEMLGRVVAEILDTGSKKIVIDLGAVNYMDSAGLGEVVACRRAVDAVGGSFALAGAEGKVRDLLEVTRIDRVLDVYSDVEAATAGG